MQRDSENVDEVNVLNKFIRRLIDWTLKFQSVGFYFSGFHSWVIHSGRYFHFLINKFPIFLFISAQLPHLHAFIDRYQANRSYEDNLIRFRVRLYFIHPTIFLNSIQRIILPLYSLPDHFFVIVMKIFTACKIIVNLDYFDSEKQELRVTPVPLLGSFPLVS